MTSDANEGAGLHWSRRAVETQLGAGETSVLVMPARASSLVVYVDGRGDANMNGATVKVCDAWTGATLKSAVTVGTGPQRVIALSGVVGAGPFEVRVTPIGALSTVVRIAARAQGEEP